MSAPVDLPVIVSRALDLSRRRGFVTSSRLETGRLLSALATSRQGTLGECGTGCGVGAAWLSSGSRAGSRVVTAEVDENLAEAVTNLFRDDSRVEVLTGDWGALRDHGPFSLLFLDVREAKRSGADTVAEMLDPGGIVVLDDFTPCATWPPMYEGRVDTMREQWLTDQRFTTVEVMVATDAAVLIASRR
ncbi:MAG: class I SAM-dependent methyltransferase [Propionibacteriales bacterium]|nr:class I SAM-dependent methyltransferase [Propionibacteriales bacterium]